MSVPVIRGFKPRELRIIERMVHGDSPREACAKAGFPYHHPERYITPKMVAEVERISAELTEQARQKCLIDAGEIHEYLSDAIRADWSDIENDDGTFKPLSEWPSIWRRMKEKGDVEVELENVRSHDGKDTEGRGGWERGKKVVRKVKIAFASRTKLLELAMKHRAVDAMVKQDKPDVHVHLHAQVTARLQGALERERKLIDVMPERDSDV